MLTTKWHTLTVDEVLQQLKTHAEYGLTSDEAEKRHQQYGANQLAETIPPSFWQRLFTQFHNFVVYLLIFAAAASFVLGDRIEAVAILAIVLLNAILGVVQEGRAEESLKSLKILAAPTAKVLREGKLERLDAAQLVPGELVVLETGDYVPADMRLIQTINLKISEASLTGESVAIEKEAQIVAAQDAVPGDRRNMAFLGTLVTYGRGRGIVTATGMDTEVGHITELLQSTETEDTPLQKRLDQLGRTLSIAALVICGVVFVMGAIQDLRAGLSLIDSLKESFIIAISLAIAAVPEGLPAVVTINLALGMRRMIQSHALIRRLPAVETLGSATVIASDKTGTLTQNQMTAVSLYTSGHLIDLTRSKGDVIGLQAPEVQQLILGGLLASDARLESHSHVVGDATEAALVILAEKNNLHREIVEKDYPRVAEIPFDSERKRMTTLHQTADGTYLAFVKGAPDILLNLCDTICENGQSLPLTAQHRETLDHVNQKMAAGTLRVLAVAQKRLDDLPPLVTPETIEQHLDLLGLVALRDPARPEVAEAIARARRAGIKTLMITGDYADTAQAIASEIGLICEDGRVMSGEELESLSDEALARQIDNTDVFARVSPHHKVRIVEALQSRGHIAAMTGDGVNDAPALKRANIGIAMGLTGTDVSKESADMILTDDNYASIVAAVEQGRIIYSNIRKFVYYLLSCNLAEICVIFIATLMGWPAPLTAIQLLWLNLITDGAPALALGLEGGDPDIMNQPPRSPNEMIINRNMQIGIVIQTIVMTAVTLLAFGIGRGTIRLPLLALQASDNLGQVMAFVTLSICELVRAYSSRSELHSVFAIGLWSNPYMQYAVFSSLVGLLVVIYVPFLQPIFNTTALQPVHWLIVIPLVLFPTVVAEMTKIYLRRLHSSPTVSATG